MNDSFSIGLRCCFITLALWCFVLIESVQYEFSLGINQDDLASFVTNYETVAIGTAAVKGRGSVDLYVD